MAAKEIGSRARTLYNNKITEDVAPTIADIEKAMHARAAAGYFDVHLFYADLFHADKLRVIKKRFEGTGVLISDIDGKTFTFSWRHPLSGPLGLGLSAKAKAWALTHAQADALLLGLAQACNEAAEKRETSFVAYKQGYSLSWAEWHPALRLGGELPGHGTERLDAVRTIVESTDLKWVTASSSQGDTEVAVVTIKF